MSHLHKHHQDNQEYTCTVTVEGRVNINDTAGYDFDNKGGGTTSASITGKCVTAVLNYTAHY